MQHCIMCGSTFSYTVWRVLLMHTCAPAISITAQLIMLLVPLRFMLSGVYHATRILDYIIISSMTMKIE